MDSLESFCKDLKHCYWEDYSDEKFEEIKNDAKKLFESRGVLDYQYFPPTFRWHLCAARLAQGKFDNWDGWEFRSNWSITFQGWNGFKMSIPKWTGRVVKKLIISSEQGIGDEICYASAIPELIVRLGHEALEIQCHPRLAPIFERSFHIKAVPRLTLGNIKEGDAVVALADLFMFYRRDKSHFPKKPFLKPNHELKDKWLTFLEKFPRPWIGLGWKSRHGHIDPNELISGEGTFFNLQYGDDSSRSINGIVTLGCSAMESMDDHIALVSCMDKIVSVTQTLCHEAGSIGVPCEAIKPPKGTGEVDCILWYYGNGDPVGDNLVYGNQKVYASLENWKKR